MTKRPITLCTGQWADIPIVELAKKAAEWGYDGLELACWGDHLDVEKAAVDLDYCKIHLEKLAKYGMKVYAISNHLAGQLVCDPNNDSRSNEFAPDYCTGHAEKKREWGIDMMKKSAVAAKNLGVKVVNGFTGSSIWHYFYSFPPVTNAMIDKGFEHFAELWNPILDVFDENGAKFALEVHPTEIAFDIVTAKRALEAVNYHKAFGFNFDPSHLHWQMVDPVFFIHEFHDRIYHCHMKDAALQLNGRTGILGSHLNFGHPERGWDFRSLGRGDIDFEEIIRAFNHIGYTGPLSVEWEDSGMDREYGAEEACNFVKQLDFKTSGIAFDAAFDK
ncbi:MAG: sugar phosphate isomerase/epimerase [Candidatus Marinimicrobia bacterium]|nr:sugar phosphate isomerase/epimerase [Candidatus Neomarinimicrobiota bacterium]